MVTKDTIIKKCYDKIYDELRYLDENIIMYYNYITQTKLKHPLTYHEIRSIPYFNEMNDWISECILSYAYDYVDIKYTDSDYKSIVKVYSDFNVETDVDYDEISSIENYIEQTYEENPNKFIAIAALDHDFTSGDLGTIVFDKAFAQLYRDIKYMKPYVKYILESEYNQDRINEDIDF